MKKNILPLAALAFLTASCSLNSENTGSTTYYTYNLIIDNDNPDQKAQASYGSYSAQYDYNRGSVSIQGTDIIINNQKQTFETDTMAYRPYYFETTIDGVKTTIGQTVFSKSGQAGIGSSASNVKGAVTGIYARATTDTLSSTSNVYMKEFLDINYTLSNRYQVKTFWADALYLGQTFASGSDESFSSRTPRYMTYLDFTKNTADVYIYNLEISETDKTLPEVIKIANIPVNFNHDTFYLEAPSPKTTVLSKRNNTPVLIDSVGFQVENFSLRISPEDLFDANISYKLKGKAINFAGSCAPRPQ